MTEIISEPFDWNDNFSEIAQEDFSMIRKDLSYGTATTIGTHLRNWSCWKSKDARLRKARVRNDTYNLL